MIIDLFLKPQLRLTEVGESAFYVTVANINEIAMVTKLQLKLTALGGSSPSLQNTFKNSFISTIIYLTIFFYVPLHFDQSMIRT